MKSVDFHGYTIYENGEVLGLYGKKVKTRERDGRIEIKIRVDGKRKNFTLSRLVYYAFFPFDIDDKNLCVSYKDNNPSNVHLSNLYLTNRKELIQGEKHTNRSKITNEQAEEIRQLYKGKSGSNQYNKVGYSQLELAKMYGVSKANIKMIVDGRNRNEKEYKL